MPPARSRYLAEIAETVRGYHATAAEQARLAREAQQLDAAGRLLSECGGDGTPAAKLAAERRGALDHRARRLLETWPSLKAKYERDELISTVRGRETRSALTTTTLSGTRIRKVVPPEFGDHGDLLRWLLRENLPGRFPYTAGAFATKRDQEDPTRMFAGEGDPFRTNARFKLLSRDSAATRLSTAFDFGDALRLRPGRTPRRLGQGRQLGGFDRHP